MLASDIDNLDILRISTPENAKILFDKDNFAVFSLSNMMDEENFIASWNNLVTDLYMADHGTYRKRRYNNFSYDFENKSLTINQGTPHFQEKKYNSANGDQNRYYHSLEKETLESRAFQKILDFYIQVIGKITHYNKWIIETHQFRIISEHQKPGLPTPEGQHRDGVNYVFIMLINRKNIFGGKNRFRRIFDKKNMEIMLLNSFDAILLDDHKFLHSVTPIVQKQQNISAYRDTLVITFKKCPDT